MLLLSASSCSSAIQTKTPYLQNLSGNSVTICWETDKPSTGIIEIQPQGGKKYSLAESKNATFHEVVIPNLAPGKSYSYTVTAGSLKSGGSFRTDPLKPEPFTFVVYGDCRSGHPMHKQLMKVAQKYNPALVLNTGDLVADGRKQAEWDTFWGIVGPISRNAAYYPTLGNHEKESDLYYHYFSLPDSGLGEANYTFTYAGAYFISLDVSESIMIDVKQKKWLAQKLEAAKKYDYIFVFFHVPMYSSSKRSPNLQLRKTLGPLFEKYRVTAVFNGHDHFYERSIANGIPYIIAGGGGAELYDFERENPESVFKSKENHIVVINVRGKTAQVETRNINNKVIDSFTLKSRN